MKKIGLYILLVSILFSVVYLISFVPKEFANYTDGPFITSINDSTFISLELEVSENEKGVHTHYKHDTLTFSQVIDQYHIDRTVDEGLVYENVNKIFALGDVHGNYNALLKILMEASVIDENYDWSFENGHVVIAGDVFDRGDQVTECLWLLHKLEYQALSNGGRVHFLLGNHEVMFLNGDLRYINEKYKAIQESLGFRYNLLYSGNSIIGHWVRNRPFYVIINNILFVHGGISIDLLESSLSLEDYNLKLKAYLNSYLIDDEIKVLIGPKGPLWYRGYIEDDNLQLSDIEKIVEALEVDKIVFAHTKVDAIKPLFDGLLVPIGVEINDTKASCLIIHKDGSTEIVGY